MTRCSRRSTEERRELALRARTLRPRYKRTARLRALRRGFRFCLRERRLSRQTKASIAVLTNQDASPAAGAIARAIAPLILGLSGGKFPAAAAETQAREIFVGLQQGKIDRSLFTDNCNAYFGDQQGSPTSNRASSSARRACFLHPGRTESTRRHDLPLLPVEFTKSPQQGPRDDLHHAGRQARTVSGHSRAVKQG